MQQYTKPVKAQQEPAFGIRMRSIQHWKCENLADRHSRWFRGCILKENDTAVVQMALCIQSALKIMIKKTLYGLQLHIGK